MMATDGDDDAPVIKGTGVEDLVIGAPVNGVGSGVEEKHVGDGSGKLVFVEQRVDDVAHRLGVSLKRDWRKGVEDK